ncbi:MAG: hypothetical protein AAF797_10305 [Planctomycetota bacterium]
MLRCAFYKNRVVMMAGLALFALVSGGPVIAQATQPAAAPSPGVDESLRAALTESGASFEELPSGDFLVRFRQNPEDAQGMPVVVRSRRLTIAGQELRNIFVVLARGTGGIRQSVINQLMVTNGSLPVGGWGVERLAEGRFLVLFKVAVPADAPPAVVYGMAQYVAQVAFRQRAQIAAMLQAEQAATQPATDPAAEPADEPAAEPEE